jgi:hypothetical protein
LPSCRCRRRRVRVGAEHAVDLDRVVVDGGAFNASTPPTSLYVAINAAPVAPLPVVVLFNAPGCRSGWIAALSLKMPAPPWLACSVVLSMALSLIVIVPG